MGYSIESDGSRRYTLTSKKEIVSPAEGEDYSIDHVKSRLGTLATVHGRIYRPINRPEHPLKVINANGFMATSDIYDDTAAQLASIGGADAAVFDTWHPLTYHDFEDPLLVASMGGHAMLDIMEILTEERTDTVAAGHSMGGLVAARLAAYDSRIGFWLGDASAGVEHENMTKVHIENGKEILLEEAIPIGKYAAEKIGVLKLAIKYLLRIGVNPSQVIRQAYLLCTKSDISPYLRPAADRGVVNGVIIHEFDAFFKAKKQLAITEQNPDIYHIVHESKGTKHGHANTHARENAIIRMDVIHQMQAKKLADTALVASAAGQ